MLNSILRRFRSKRARTNKPNDDNASHECHASCSFCGTENMAARHSNRLVRIGSALSRSVVVSLVCVEVCRGLSSCRAVELDTLTPRRMQSGGALSYSVEVCRELSSSCQAILSSSCRVTVELLSSILSSSCRVSCRVVSRPGLKTGFCLVTHVRSNQNGGRLTSSGVAAAQFDATRLSLAAASSGQKRARW